MAAHLETVPTDVLGDDLIRTYRAGAHRLEQQVRAALAIGLDPNRIGTDAQVSGDATAAYRDRQLRAARLTIAELEATGRRAAPHVAAAAYRSAVVAVDRTVTRGGAMAPGIAGRFGGIHQRAVEVIAANMSDSLAGAAQRAGANVEHVFARAALLEGAHRPGQSPLRGFPFVGRRTDDAWRQVALETIGAGNVGTDTRRQITRTMARRLIDDGVTDALTGYVDRAGRRWPLAHYAAMVTRTTTREATTRATVARLGDHGQDLVTISSHPHAADECTPYDGVTFSISGEDDRYDALDEYPPFHPNCRHVVTPSSASSDDYLGDLEAAVRGELDPAQVAAGPRARGELAPARLLRGDDAVAHVRGKVEELPDDLDKAVKTYGRSAYQPVNDYLRGIEDPGGRRGKLDELIGRVDTAIARQRPTTSPLELHRYSYTNLDLEVGREFVDPAYVSTSLKPGVYGGNAPERQGDLIRIIAPPGTRGADMNALGAARSEQELEYLLPRGSRFVVDRIDASAPGARRVDVRLLVDEAPPPADALRARGEVAPPRPDAAERPRPPDTTTPPPAGQEGPPLGRRVPPASDAGTAGRLDAQRVAYAIANDPGPEEGAAAAWGKWVAKHGREANKALNEALGPFNAKYIDRKAFVDERVRERLLNGELTIDHVEDMVAAHWEEAEGKRLTRKAHREQDYGYSKKPFPCFSCGSFKRRPADVCEVCGDDPVSTASYGLHGRSVGENQATPAECLAFNRAYGYGSL